MPGVGSPWNIRCACSTKTTTVKAPQTSGQWQVKAVKQGQPTHATHPHILQEGEVLPWPRVYPVKVFSASGYQK